MKEYTLKFSLRQLMAIAIGLPLLLTVLSFSLEEGEENSPITLEQAQTFFSRNKQATTPFGGGLNGVAITTDMLNALNAVSNNVEGESGYRCYFGMDENSNSVSVVVAIDDRNVDLVSYIESGEAGLFSTCPTICDLSSAITNP